MIGPPVSRPSRKSSHLHRPPPGTDGAQRKRGVPPHDAVDAEDAMALRFRPSQAGASVDPPPSRNRTPPSGETVGRARNGRSGRWRDPPSSQGRCSDGGSGRPYTGPPSFARQRRRWSCRTGDRVHLGSRDAACTIRRGGGARASHAHTLGRPTTSDPPASPRAHFARSSSCPRHGVRCPPKGARGPDHATLRSARRRRKRRRRLGAMPLTMIGRSSSAQGPYPQPPGERIGPPRRTSPASAEPRLRCHSEAGAGVMVDRTAAADRFPL